MPATTQAADADLEVRVTKFVEYVNPAAFCPYKMTPLPSHNSPPAKNAGDAKKGKWEFGSRVSLHVGHYQKPDTYAATPQVPTTVRLEEQNQRAVLRYKVVVDGAKPRDYHIIGLSFTRGDLTPPVGARFTTGNVSPGNAGNPDNDNTPFGNVKLNEDESIVEFEMVSVHKLNSRPHQDHSGNAIGGGVDGTHRTYRFMIIIQEAATGRIGIIDPENEMPNN